jgi:hypothetical protein
MLLSAFTRQSTGCKFSKDRACRRCNCPKWSAARSTDTTSARAQRRASGPRPKLFARQLEEALAFGSATATADSTIPETTALPTPVTTSTDAQAVPSHETQETRNHLPQTIPSPGRQFRASSTWTEPNEFEGAILATTAIKNTFMAG